MSTTLSNETQKKLDQAVHIAVLELLLEPEYGIDFIREMLSSEGIDITEDGESAGDVVNPHDAGGMVDLKLALFARGLVAKVENETLREIYTKKVNDRLLSDS